MTPVSTSPDPAVAIPALPVELTATRPSLKVTTVGAPFNTSVAPNSPAKSRATAMGASIICRLSNPLKRANSPTWGVRTSGAERPFSTSACPANALSPSASKTTGSSVLQHQPPHQLLGLPIAPQPRSQGQDIDPRQHSAHRAQGPQRQNSAACALRAMAGSLPRRA